MIEFFALTIMLCSISVALGVWLRDIIFPDDPGRVWRTESGFEDVAEYRDGELLSLNR